MKTWTRDHTKDWITKLESRVEDIEFYLSRALGWCEENEVYSDKAVFACSMMTIAWVCYLRNEMISKHELFEILGVQDWDTVDDELLAFNPKYGDMELEELLEVVASSFY